METGGERYRHIEIKTPIAEKQTELDIYAGKQNVAIPANWAAPFNAKYFVRSSIVVILAVCDRVTARGPVPKPANSRDIISSACEEFA